MHPSLCSGLSATPGETRMEGSGKMLEPQRDANRCNCRIVIFGSVGTVASQVKPNLPGKEGLEKQPERGERASVRVGNSGKEFKESGELQEAE